MTTKRLLTFATLLALFLILAPGAATLAAAADHTKAETPATAKPANPDSGGLEWLDPSGNQAQCIADCGDGTGWECTGQSVTCVDGEGCVAQGGGKTAIGLCN